MAACSASSERTQSVSAPWVRSKIRL